MRLAGTIVIYCFDMHNKTNQSSPRGKETSGCLWNTGPQRNKPHKMNTQRFFMYSLTTDLSFIKLSHTISYVALHFWQKSHKQGEGKRRGENVFQKKLLKNYLAAKLIKSNCHTQRIVNQFHAFQKQCACGRETQTKSNIPGKWVLGSCHIDQYLTGPELWSRTVGRCAVVRFI